MKRKYQIKKHAQNDFSAITGVEAFEVFGGSECLVTKYKTRLGNVPIIKYAYEMYYDIFTMNRNIRIFTACGALNCVKKSHLKAVYEPSKADLDYIKTYLKRADDEESVAHTLNVPIHLFHRFINSLDK